MIPVRAPVRIDAAAFRTYHERIAPSTDRGMLPSEVADLLAGAGVADGLTQISDAVPAHRKRSIIPWHPAGHGVLRSDFAGFRRMRWRGDPAVGSPAGLRAHFRRWAWAPSLDFHRAGLDAEPRAAGLGPRHRPARPDCSLILRWAWAPSLGLHRGKRGRVEASDASWRAAPSFPRRAWAPSFGFRRPRPRRRFEGCGRAAPFGTAGHRLRRPFDPSGRLDGFLLGL